MGLPVDKLVIATNENDILHRFWQSGVYEKQAKEGKQEVDEVKEAVGALADPGGVKMTYAPAMDILVSSNFERLLWFLAYKTSGVEEVNHRRMEAGERVKGWLDELKKNGGFSVPKNILDAAREQFASERVSNSQTISTIRDVQKQETDVREVAGRDGKVATTGMLYQGRYILDPHSAIGVAASLRRIEGEKDDVHHISLATAHPAKFSAAVEMALQEVEGFTFETVLPEQFKGLMDLEKRVVDCKAEWEAVREIVVREVEEELKGSGKN
jgi:threonine synthase